MDRRNWLEWLALAISIAAVLGMVGVLVVDAFQDQGRPPIPTVVLHPDDAYATDIGWLLPATVGNAGDEAAQGVVVVATASVSGREEQAEVTIDYLPPGSLVDVTFGFSVRPQGEVGVHVAGFVP